MISTHHRWLKLILSSKWATSVGVSTSCTLKQQFWAILIVFSWNEPRYLEKRLINVNARLSGQECMLLIDVSVAKQHDNKSNQKRLWLEIGGDWRSWHVAVDPSCAGFPTDLLPRKYMGWQCRRSRSREESNPLSFQWSWDIAISCWSCMLEQADGPKLVWSPHGLCLSRVRFVLVRLTQSLLLASVWGHSTHRWPGVGRTMRGPSCIMRRKFWASGQPTWCSVDDNETMR